MKTMIAMSGGVDSSVAARLLLDAGHDCIGATMRLHGSFCGTDGEKDAAEVAKQLGIPHTAYDLEGDFEAEVIQPFAETYLAGGTPNPCILCNRRLKFGTLYEKASELSCDRVATGHYARIAYSEKHRRRVLMRGRDAGKDQSYVLYGMTREQIEHTLFPIGELPKDAVRDIARTAGLSCAERKDSQDICFVPDGDYAAFLERYLGQKFAEGDFVDGDGNVLGRHRGIVRYTVGQRKGLGLSLPAPLYVGGKDPVKNTVLLVPEERLFTDRVRVCDVILSALDELRDGLPVSAKIRYNQTAMPARVSDVRADSFQLIFETPVRAPAKGQAAVLYDGDVVIGGGTIC
ncbi:MAG: tRNA 2-thiouridine(34) synthase MnmA [Clostridia bacterium]|nr:tRNA 2-thiouridine(34) synthase MnmA [Clostridia bacterium]